MKVVHLCLGSFYPDGYSYQENLLPKFHKALGYEVEVIASTQSFDANGKPCYMDKTGSYQNEYDIKVTRLPYKSSSRVWKKLKKYQGTYQAIEKAQPDIIFMHGIQFSDVPEVIRYLKKHPQTAVYADNHADFSNSATNWFSKNILHKMIWRYYAQMLVPYVKKFYGVLPVRVDFLKDIYGLPAEKCELLVMGADDDWVGEAKEHNQRIKVRNKYGFSDEDFVVVTGGKINQYRPETLHLMEAVIDSKSSNLKLLVFGNVDDSLKPEFEKLCESSRIKFTGWQNAKETYYLMAAADLVVFPGLHSVMWEQAVALGVPCIFRDIEGFHHVDLGGNAVFLKDVSKKSLQNEIEILSSDTTVYNEMKRTAENKGMNAFSYLAIAKKSIEYEDA